MQRHESRSEHGLRGAIARMREFRQQVRTQRALGALPEYIRRDIGWPDIVGSDRMRSGR